MLAGRAVKDLVVELGIAQVTLYNWRRPALIDAGLRPGLKSYETDRWRRPAGASTSSRPSSGRSGRSGPPTDLRSLDAIHLAGALSVKANLTALVPYDSRRFSAATDSGIELVSPAWPSLLVIRRSSASQKPP
jgi:hypothetical protein